jgi:hypothetical protein
MKSFFQRVALVCAFAPSLFWISNSFGASSAGPTVRQASSFGVSAPVRDIQPTAPPASAFKVKTIPLWVRGPSVGTGVVDPVLQSVAPTGLMPSPTLVFEGLSSADNSAEQGFTVAPPDTNGDVGPNHYVQMVNLLYRVFDKTTGAPLTAPLRLSDLYASAGVPCGDSDDGDPVVMYDHLADRWILTQFANVDAGPPTYQTIAVSTTGDPTGSYYVYCFQMPNDKFNDYPKLSVWPDGYYMTDNQFDLTTGAAQGVGVFAFDRAKMLAGDPSASYIYFDLETTVPSAWGMLPSDLDGPPPAPGTPNVCAFADEPNAIRLFAFAADFAVPANSTFTELPESPVAVAVFNSSICSAIRGRCIPQPGTTTALEAIADRLMFRLQFRNFGAYESLVVNQTVNADGAGRAGIRYYEFRRPLPGGAFFVNEQATFSPDTESRWMGSAAMDGSGNIAVGYSVSSSSVFPSIRYAGRLANDPPGGLYQGEAVMYAGTAAQTGLSRWGDYSALTVDPSDDCTFWFTTEYIPTTGSFNWRTKIGSFRFAECTGTGPGALNPLKIGGSILSGGNGNGVVDFNECNNLSVILTNISTNAINGVIEGQLASTTPGVVVNQGFAVFSTTGLSADGSVTNSASPFTFTTSPSFTFGTVIKI